MDHLKLFNNFYFNVQLLSQNAKVPTRANVEDAGIDLYTPITFCIPPRDHKLISLDIRVEFPTGFAFIIKEKSGIATKKRCHVGACVVDSSYRGTVHVHLFNESDSEVLFESGDKIAQGIIIPVWLGEPVIVSEIDINTSRGTGGFGSSGK